MAHDFEEERMTMLFAPEVQHVFIFTFINPNWNDQFNELYFYTIHFFPLITSDTHLPSAFVHLWSTWGKFWCTRIIEE